MCNILVFYNWMLLWFEYIFNRYSLSYLTSIINITAKKYNIMLFKVTKITLVRLNLSLFNICICSQGKLILSISNENETTSTLQYWNFNKFRLIWAKLGREKNLIKVISLKAHQKYIFHKILDFIHTTSRYVYHN